MNNNYKVSVIVPIYNVEAYLARCIESILKQTYHNLEIILVSDGATDNSGTIVKQYANLDGRIVTVYKEHGGVSDARNAGINAATGDYICFVDSDDFVHPQYVEILLGLCVKHECDIAQCCFEHTSEERFSEEKGTGEVSFFDSIGILNAIFSEKNVEINVLWNKLYKRELFEQIRFPAGRIHEDEATCYKVYYKAKKIARIDRVLYMYYKNMNSITKKTYSLKRLDILLALEERMQFFHENGLDQLYAKDSYKYLCKILIQIYLVSNMESPDRTVLKELKKKYWTKLGDSGKFDWSIKRKTALLFFGIFPKLYVPLVRKDNY